MMNHPAMQAMALLGTMFVLASMICAVVPGLSFHVYFGTSDGADKWHEQAIEKKNSEVNIK